MIFWDFDGVIKDSVAVKSAAFERLFKGFGTEVADRVRQHHEAHGGVSRFEKMPIYLEWAGETATPALVKEYCEQFSRLVLQAVIECAWIPGVREYLEAHHSRQRFVLLTATPHAEIHLILNALEISHWFREIHGAPTPKSTAIGQALARLRCPREEALVVGDSASDLEAAETNGVTFLLRCTTLNRALQERYSGPKFHDLTNEQTKCDTTAP